MKTELENYKIGSLYKVMLNNDPRIHAVVVIAVCHRDVKSIKVGLIYLPFKSGMDEDSVDLWSKTIEWRQADNVNDPLWNHITAQQFHEIKGSLFDEYIPITFEEYKELLLDKKT